ncbi:unnamed protein product, partial [Prorocentrum cordatum]
MARRHAGARDSAGVQLSPLLQNPGPAPKGEHVDVGAGLAQITLSGLPQSLWPRSAKTDALDTEVQRAEDRGIAHPFSKKELAKFQPLCARGAGDPPDDDEPELKEAAALARALGRGAAAESQPLLTWTPRHRAFDAWSAAAAVTDQRSRASAMVALDAPVQGRKAQVASVYDRLAQRTWAERAAAGVA